MYKRLHTIPACDVRTDRRTDILLRHTRRAVKVLKILTDTIVTKTTCANNLTSEDENNIAQTAIS